MKRRLGATLCTAACLFAPAFVVAQSERDVGAAWGGGALGAYSGATLGLAGALAPCNLVMEAGRCAGVSAVVGALVGAASGAVLAYDDPDALRDRLRGAGVGALAGAALGAVVRLRIRQIEWKDVAAAAAVGAAVGTAPTGASVGLGAGAVLGAVLWVALPGVHLPEAVALGVVGLAIGGVADWAYSALSGGGEPAAVAARISVSL